MPTMAAKKKANMAEAQKTVKPVTKKKAPVPNTGGKGFSFEDAIAARFMLDMLGQTSVLGADDFGRVTRLDWQASDTGWLLDDLLVTSFDGRRKRVAGASIKSGQKVTKRGFPVEFVRLVWSQALKRGTSLEFAGTDNVALFITGDGTAAARTPWSNLLAQALKAAPERFLARIASTTEDGAQFSAAAKAIFESFRCPTNIREGVPDISTSLILKQVRWLDFDYERPSSQSRGIDLTLATALLVPAEANRAGELLDALEKIAKSFRVAGGTLELPKLLDELGGKFALRQHPDYAGDWEALNSRTQAELSIIRTDIAGLPSLDRRADLTEIASAVTKRSACFLVGDSGSGKTAIATQLAATYSSVLWLNGGLLDYASLPDLQRAIGLTHSVADVIGSTVPVTLIIADAVEGYSDNAKKVLAQLVTSIRQSPAATRAHFLFTTQLESAASISGDLGSLGIPADALEPTILNKPSVEDVATLVASIPNVRWVALNHEVRSLLTNLKMLDWFVRFAQGGGQLGTAVVGLTNLIDALWDYWVARGTDGPARADLLKQVGAIEADEHLLSVPTSKLGHAEQMTLGKLLDTELLRRRDERVQFAHDLLADWARLRVLIGEDWVTDEAKRERFTMPKWFRAVRLYAQRLLEQSDGTQWQKQLEKLGDTTTGTLVRDLYLEALFLAPNASALLQQAWPVLKVNNAALLKVLLKRFLYVATIPDARLSRMLGAEEDATRFEHLMRFPSWPYWGPVLTVLLDNLQDTVTLVPHETAKLCGLWLRSMNWETVPGSSIPWRKEAAKLALAIARQIQINDAVRAPYSSAGTKEIFEALLLAGAELPAEVGQLCLELCHRRDISEDAKARIMAGLKKRDDERATVVSSAPPQKKRRLPAPIMSFRGKLRDPWPDGPSERVDHHFVDAVLGGVAFAGLAKCNPDASLEILLATCIEEPQHEEYGSSTHDETGLNYWQGGQPPMWYRGPFYQFLNVASEQGLTFVIKLINFVTEQYSPNSFAMLEIDCAEVKWLGDGNANAFSWHYDGHLWNGEIAQCALMALEKWLYDQLDAGRDIEPALRRIMTESRSIAFAGLLMTVGKLKPELFLGVLAPLVAYWTFLDWDTQLTNQREVLGRGILGGWSFESRPEIEAAQAWAALPHRGHVARDLMVRELLPLEKHAAFFKSVTSNWNTQLDNQKKPLPLRRLIESLTRANFEFAVVNGKLSPVKFTQAPEDAAEDAALQAEATRDLTAISLPMRCRKLLNERPTIPDKELQPFFDLVRKQHDEAASIEHLQTTADIVLAGVAVLVCLRYDWLEANPEALKWCLARLTEYTDAPERPHPFYSEINHGNDKADAFAAEAGLALLVRNSDDQLARRLVAAAVTGHFLSTTQLAVNRVVENAGKLGDDFRRVLALGLGWAGLRRCLSMFRPDETDGVAPWAARKAALISGFIDKSLAPEVPDLVALNAKAREDLGGIYALKNPRRAAFLHSKAERMQEECGRKKYYPERVSFDERLVQACLGWLSPKNTGGFTRQEALDLIRQMMGFILEGVPKVVTGEKAEIDGLPDEFDGWVLEKVARTIPTLIAAESPEGIWKPLLALGPHAHQWIKRFYWQWFTLGFDADAAQFFVQWRMMVEFVLTDPRWDPKANWHYRMDDAIYELLGFDARWNRWVNSDIARGHIAAMTDLFERVAAKWFSLPKVLNGWTHFAQHQAVATLAVKSLPWIESATRIYQDWDWRHGTEDTLIDFLSICWQNGRDEILADQKIKTAFMAMVKALAARGSHSALALQQRVTR